MSIVLYHGSNVTIDKVDLSKGAADKDFGKGFYLTDIRFQAEEMAKRRTRITGTGQPTVTSFLFDDAFLNNTELKVKVFPDEPNEEWAKFVYSNRHSSETGYCHSYDIVVGPVADDGVAYQLERYHEGVIDLLTLAKELRYRKLNRQFFFGTEKAIAKLKLI
jgi:hypothetical protein